MKYFFSFFLFYIFAGIANSQQKHDFSFSKNDFMLDGKPFQLISGEMHPARIPKIYWRHRIQMAKAMGCNTIAAYLFWNYVEEKEGVYDFKSENRDIAEFVKICQDEGMWVLFRPGPYVCAEWDFGGLPPYLLSIPDIKIRCMDPRYMASVTKYVSEVSNQIRPLLCSNGGPIIMVQVENEYGSYGNDKDYMNAIQKLWIDNGINVPFYTADGPASFLLEAGTVEGAAIGLDSGSSDADFDRAAKQNPNVPSFSAETYPGWLTHWNEKYQKPAVEDIVKQVSYLMDHKKSFNLYVIHGGTNFGFNAGANSSNRTQFQPDITSYDYDAPINERGEPTTKYMALRNLIAKYNKKKLPKIPEPTAVTEVPEFEMKPFTSVWNELPAGIKSTQVKSMESMGQYAGFILYRTKLIGRKSGELVINEPHDYAKVLLNGKLVDTIYRDGGKWTVKLPESDVKDPVLEILVENMGHINFGQFVIDRKGITDRVTLEGMTLFNWEIFNLPMNDQYIQSLKSHENSDLHDGVFFKGSFKLKLTADTYLDLSKFKKGVIWVNGHNLGRFWNVGPQFRLYCPANWLKKGENEVLVFDWHQKSASSIKGVKTLE
ncbi:beta-galactosidase [Flavobacterium sp. CF108]|uniref:glycoside hydrolase family 35 protein n=1 Tax=unclassified Flavobacterium TaxID=196869 RepID=UPI0008BF36BF|nr:beta-galactosidase [Flavobacterium sp. CF108]SEO94364.1 beta-galactosidase [Flavobacterium sp. fv08]SHH82785.1 beta-galactosidase [Flavobacterium sp. CF108]